GDTWNLGHEIYLASDVRVAAADTRFGQDGNTHGRFPGGGATGRFVRDAGWGNAMRYMLTGDHWTAEESYRMGITQQVAATPEAALDAGIAIARKIAACAPLSVKATLTATHQYVDPAEAEALSKLGAQYAALYRTEAFIEGRRAEAEGRLPKYQGKKASPPLHCETEDATYFLPLQTASRLRTGAAGSARAGIRYRQRDVWISDDSGPRPERK